MYCSTIQHNALFTHNNAMIINNTPAIALECEVPIILSALRLSYKDAAASTAPAALNAPLLVHFISTSCAHSMYLAQPLCTVSDIFISADGGGRTPVSELTTKIFPRKWDHDHCQQELDLFEACFPLSLCVGFAFSRAEDVAGDGGKGFNVVVVG